MAEELMKNEKAVVLRCARCGSTEFKLLMLENTGRFGSKVIDYISQCANENCKGQTCIVTVLQPFLYPREPKRVS
jgi:predicted nucleic-acid-binding Zn-ribbon protein